jgi:hypothetical protein
MCTDPLDGEQDPDEDAAGKASEVLSQWVSGSYEWLFQWEILSCHF